MTKEPSHPYEEEGFEELCELGEQMQADLLLNELAGEGIEALQYPSSTETSLNFPPPETSGGIRIFVKADQREEARALYERLEGASPSEPGR